MRNKLHYLFIVLLSSVCIAGYELKAQLSHKVLFLGNSYTYVNNLPQLVHDVALSAGDTLVFDSYTQGGYSLENHSLDPACKTKIMAGGWDYVVIQGQSQEPVLASSQFNNGAAALCSQIAQYNPCAVIMPYMTWGRKNGDAANCPNFPVVCTYQRMDSALKSRYLNLTASINGEVSPVSVVWRYLRQNHPGIDLYWPDESHPSAEGSYAAACCFYASIFKKDPTLITFDFGLNPGVASIIKNAAKTEVFNNLQAWNYKKAPVSDFDYTIGSGINTVIFNPLHKGVKQSYLWDFGDATTSTSQNPTHSYLTNGTYTVVLTTTNCDLLGVHTSSKDTVIQFCSHTPTVFTTQGWVCEYDTLWTQPADSYQWFTSGIALPETKRYVADYRKYGSSGLSVISTLNGCSELSQAFAKSSVWSGYYFDGLGDPCAGDTVKFAVLHTNGSLSGAEKILWFKDGALLPSLTNEDTLLIYGSGKYECKIVNPNSNCPLDTTSYSLKYDCGDLSGIVEKEKELSWSIAPNPASESITLKFKNNSLTTQIQIYNATGSFTKTVDVVGTTRINIADLPAGLYFVRLKNNEGHVVKFIKDQE